MKARVRERGSVLLWEAMSTADVYLEKRESVCVRCGFTLCKKTERMQREREIETERNVYRVRDRQSQTHKVLLTLRLKRGEEERQRQRETSEKDREKKAEAEGETKKRHGVCNRQMKHRETYVSRVKREHGRRGEEIN